MGGFPLLFTFGLLNIAFVILIMSALWPFVHHHFITLMRQAGFIPCALVVAARRQAGWLMPHMCCQIIGALLTFAGFGIGVHLRRLHHILSH
jgi:hypothetical protein